MAQQGGKQPSSGSQAQQGKSSAPSTTPNKNQGPDNPSKHSTDEPANKEPHRESGSGRHEPSP